MSDSTSKASQGNQGVNLINWDSYMSYKLTDPVFKREWDKVTELTDEEFLQQEHDALMKLEGSSGEFPDSQ